VETELYSLTAVKRLQWKIDDTGTVNRPHLAVEENEELLLNKNAV